MIEFLTILLSATPIPADETSPLSAGASLPNPVHDKLAEKLKDRRWRLDNLYWIVNEKGEEVLFRLNFVQKLLFHALWYFNVILKSRQHGVTTFFAILYLDICLFNSNVHALLIAHSREESEEIFERNVKHAYDRLDPNVRAARLAKSDSKRKLVFANGSSIRVTTSGRSGTFQLVHISELGKVAAKFPEKSREIKTGTLNAIHAGQIVTIESTAEGREGDFYEICELARKATIKEKTGHKLSIMEPRFHFFPWYLNPLNVVDPHGVPILKYQAEYFAKIETELHITLRMEQKAWYVLKQNVQGEDMKREHPSTPEEAFFAAVVGTYYATQFTKIREQGRITLVPHIDGTLVDTWWDIGIGDDTAIWFTQNVGREIHVIDYYENSGEGFSHYKETLDKLKTEKRYQYGVMGAPHDIAEREWLSGQSRIKAAAALGIHFHRAPRLTIESGIEAVRRILSICVFDEEQCEKGIKCLESYRKEWNKDLQTYRNTPLHDWSSHGSDAFRTMAVLHKFKGYVQGLTDQASIQQAFKQDKSSRITQGDGMTITPNQARKDPRSWT